MMTMLPDNLVEEILSRVPATCLKRLRSTCKLWNGIFNDRRFAKNHFDKAPKQYMVLKLTEEYRLCSFRGELGLIDPVCSAQFRISHVFHCDGLLLCTSESYNRIVVWNPCTGQTKWITDPSDRVMFWVTFTLGRCYQENNYSYKLLRHVPCYEKLIFEICEINSDSCWRIPHDVTPDCLLQFAHYSVYLKGKTYWCASDSKEFDACMHLLSFDYTTERFGRLCLPGPYCRLHTVSLSVVREEKLSVLLRPHDRLGNEIEIWISSPIDDPKAVSWSKIFALDDPRLGYCTQTSFLVDDEKKIATCLERWIRSRDNAKAKLYYVLQYIVGEDNEVTLLDFGASSNLHLHSQLLFNYVPSLVHIQ
ncbi:unnamed protein product [Brassica oleracea var. botrytis]|uniref:F-box domain-containing protein n=3 Tax=Brassica TaxID=3705 RepID=A0ABQ8B8R1_BRANA|nr:probable F-box protein At5g47300 [Brassica napus]KAG2249686.1 hypothetical protein Bca52824_089314 [Brassica carinata]KAH0901186.1 hypothetical protein HID58_040689 [Brassica napus]VDD48434.1 unnamed protein product [Brassica oleracea]